MAFNVYKVRKWAGTFISGFFPVFFFIIGVMFFDYFMGIALLFVGIVLGSLVSNILTRHAFSDMLEGQGLLTLTLDSTGVIIPFITGLKAPFIHGKLKGKETDGLYNREMVHYLTKPRKGNVAEFTDPESGKLRRFLELPPDDDKPDKIFSFGPYPCFIFNKCIDAYLSKDALSKFEKDIFTKHIALYILKKTEELGEIIRDFARYIVEHAKPRKFSLMKNKWIIYVIIIGIMIVLFMLFGPALIQVFNNMLSNGGGLIPNNGGGPIT